MPSIRRHRRLPDARRAASACAPTGTRANALATALAASLSAIAAPAAAQTGSTQPTAPFDYTLGASVLHSDNIGLTSIDPQSDTVIAPSFGFAFRQQGSALEANVLGDLQYLDYRDDTFADEFRGAFSGQATWTVLPQRLQLVVEDYLSRQPVDSFAAFSPGNQQQTNVFVAGPSFFGKAGATRFRTDLRYGRSTAQDVGTFDSSRYSFSEQLQRDLGPTRSLAASLQATQVDFDLGAQSDYTRYDAFATYDSRLRVIDLTVDAGYSRLNFKGDRDSATGPLLRVGTEWRAAPRSVFSGSVGYQFSDATQSLSTRVGDPAVPLDTPIGGAQVPIRPDVYRERRVELGYRFTGTRLNVSIAPYYQRIRYVESILLDQDDRGGIATLDYRLRPRTTLALSAATTTRDYAALSRRDDDAIASIGLVQQFNSHWSARVDLQRRQRSSSVAGQDYDENAATVSVSYRR